MAKCNSCVHFDVCQKYTVTVDFDVDDGVCLHYEKQVVRCKDCKHLKYGYQCYYPLGMMLNNDGDAYVLVDPDEDFCSRGERREGE